MRSSLAFLLLAALLAPGPSAAEAGSGTPALPLDAALLHQAFLLERSIRYDSEAAIRAEWGSSFDELEVVELAGVENRYLIGTRQGDRVQEIAIRGTVNLKNAIFDVEFFKQRDELAGVRLHTGFARVAKAVYRDLAPRLRPGFALRIYGHSLGAAEAIILGMLYSRDGLAVDCVVASGTPKVTDAEGWLAFPRLRVLRVAEAFDPVPFLPPANLLYGQDPYIQGGPVLLLLDGPHYAIAPSVFFDSLGRAAETAEGVKASFGLPSHSIKRYLGLIVEKGDAARAVPIEDWAAYCLPPGP